MLAFHPKIKTAQLGFLIRHRMLSIKFWVNVRLMCHEAGGQMLEQVSGF